MSGAEILTLVRDGHVTDWVTLCNRLGLSTAQYGTEHAILRTKLFELKRAGLLHWEQPDGRIAVTELVAKLQAALDLRLSELARFKPGISMIVNPVLGGDRGNDSSLDVFVVMPFSRELEPVYDDHIKKVADTLQLTIKRADEFSGSMRIMRDVWDSLRSSKVVIADCTGRNPNVFYEIGLAHAIGRPVVLLAQRKHDIPFDVQEFRHILYDFTPRGMSQFEAALTRALVQSLGLSQ